MDYISNSTKSHAIFLKWHLVVLSVFLCLVLVFCWSHQAWAFGLYDEAVAMAVDAQGNVYVTGNSDTNGGNEIATIKYAPDGKLLWVQREIGVPGTAIAIDDEGNVYVAGGVYSLPGKENTYNIIDYQPSIDTDYITIKYRSDGTRLWMRRYNGTADSLDVATAIAVDAGGDYVTVKYDPAGKELWTRRYNGTGYGTDVPSAIRLDAKGNVYVTGYSNGVYTSADYVTIAYTTEGEEMWVKRYTGVETQSDRASGITVDGQGNVYVTGASYRDGSAQDYATVAYSPAGKLLWEKRYNGSINGPDEAVAIGTDGQENVYVTGTANRYHDYATVAYRATDGKRLWTRQYRQPGGLLVNAVALAVNAHGNVAVTGLTYNFNTRYDYSTVAYNLSGKRLWVRQYHGAEGPPE